MKTLDSMWNRLQGLLKSPEPRLAWLQAADPQLAISEISYVKHILDLKDPPSAQPVPTHDAILHRTLGTAPGPFHSYDANSFGRICVFRDHQGLGPGYLHWGQHWLHESNNTVDLLVSINQDVQKTRFEYSLQSSQALCRDTQILRHDIKRERQGRVPSRSKR